MLTSIITWFLSNVFTWTPLLAILIGICRTPPINTNKYANTLRHLFLWYAGIAFLWSGIFHLLMPAFTAAKIGWANSPFQLEVGLANLSIAVLGFMAFFKKDSYFWLGVILALAVFSVGAGINHAYLFIYANDHAIDNAGVLMYTDIIAPFVMLFLWFKSDLDK